MIRMPDLLHPEPQMTSNQRHLYELLDLAFLGREAGDKIDLELGRAHHESSWDAQFFARDLFLEDLVKHVFELYIDGERFPVHDRFLLRVLCAPPTDRETILFRQDILRELLEDAGLRERTQSLYRELAKLLSMFKMPSQVGRGVDESTLRLEIFRQARTVVQEMGSGFAEAKSGLSRLHKASEEIRESEEWGILRDVLDQEEGFVRLDIHLGLSPDGHLQRIEIQRMSENTENRFHRPPLKRLFDRIRLVLWHGTLLSNREVMNRLLRTVFVQLSGALVPLVEMVGHLEFYLTALSFREQVRSRGLEVCLAEFVEDSQEPANISLTGAFNPLLMRQTLPVTASIEREHAHGVTLITGPNSGGKTRLLQTVGLAQIIGQNGLFVPASSARLPVLRGLFVSLIENEAFDHAEGRLGREMVRIRSLFEGMSSPSMVILDELCSGTNPSEGTELFSMVLELLQRLGAVGFVSTHFLDYAQELESEHPFEGLEFRQVEIDANHRSTYQFVPGVAQTSLASVTAERLGVTFERLLELIEKQR